MNDTNSADAGAEKPKRQASRGDFLKWGTVALSGMYVGPKITSFSMAQGGGQTGSVAPGQTPPSNFSPSPPSFNLPPTGGAAHSPVNRTTAVAPADAPSGTSSLLPAVGVGAAALGLYSVAKAKKGKTTEATGDTEKA